METADWEAAGGFPFLQFPRKIRNQTYSTLLDIRSYVRDRCRWTVLLHPEAGTQTNHPGDLPAIGSIACQGLRLTCYQVLSEISDTVRVADPHGGIYMLDVMVFGSNLCLSWTDFYTPLQDLRHLFVDLHVLISYGWSRNPFPGRTVKVLSMLLKTFLRTGPWFSESQTVVPALKLDAITVNAVDDVYGSACVRLR